MAETSRDDQKLWLILFQIKAIRARLNSLALQRGLFWTLAFMIAGAAGVVGAAMDLRPLPFLILALALVLLALAGSLVAIRSAWRTRTSPVRAAAIADQRGDLKGRLATVQGLALAGRASTLWPYLIEDTYGARQQFEPSHIEPRWFSRAGWALLGAMALAALLIPGSLFERNRQAAMMQAGGMPGSGAVTADINNLDIRPADPALAPNARIYADPATLARLRQRVARQSAAHGGALGKLADKARGFADAIQREITGTHPSNQPPMSMRLTDRKAKPGAGGDDDQAKASPPRPSGDGAAGGTTGGSGNGPSAPPNSLPPGSGMAAADPGASGASNSPGAQAGPPPPDSTASNDGGEGSEHGGGTDPSTLFGTASPGRLGADSFKIAIDADPSNEASSPGSPGYLPPRVRAPLNPVQYPDEPLARAAVPPADQMTIKRVFER